MHPSFQIRSDDRIFVIGSCFAREIRSALVTRGFKATDAGLGNKYNTFSILQAFSWALRNEFSDQFIIRLEDGTWFDGHRHPFHCAVELRDVVESHRKQLTDAAAAVSVCDIVVITLGLVEVWYDKQTGAWLNGTPPRQVPDFERRFSVHRTTHAENLHALLSIVNILGEFNQKLRIVCTVSPVPMRATFFGNDILIANTYSKSTLHSAVTEAIDVSMKHGGPPIDYFPSYELATLNPRVNVWRPCHPTGEPDGRHVRGEFVRDVIVRSFIEHYLIEPHIPVN